MSHKILLIEDNLLVAEDIIYTLEKSGYTLLGHARTGTEALEIAKKTPPQLIIADIILKGSHLDGIESINKIFEFYKCPVIYLTAHSGLGTVNRALETAPDVFLIKPFKPEELIANIELSIKKFRVNNSVESVNNPNQDYIFLPHMHLYYKVMIKDILFVEADGSYVKIISNEQTFHLTINLKNFILQFMADGFYRVSRKHYINLHYIHRISGNCLFIRNNKSKDFLIPITPSRKTELIDSLKIIKTTIHSK